ncbi:MAG: indolepyruvate ferredoxin oxidoreductase subunit alpha [Burkholderiaceae bacterium]
MERSFAREVELLRLGDGDVFHGEGILAITKGLLQAGVAYVGGYQGAPVSHLLDVMVQARTLLDELGVKVEACSNEASAAALLGASIHYPVRGAVTWKSIVGTNVASDALSNLSSPGVTGGALIIVGEDYGEGASVIQERSLAFALKSTLCLFDPRPDHATMVDMVAKAFELSEASNMPSMMQLRIRACHVRGSFVCSDNRAPAISMKHPFDEPAAFDYAKLPHPPATFRQEKLKGEQRIVAARAFIVEHALNDLIAPRGATSAGPSTAGIGVIVQGGLYNTLMGALVQCGLADAFGASDVAILVLNVTCPLAPLQIEAFCRAHDAVLVVEEGQPEFLEQEIATILRRARIDTPLHGKDVLPMAGEYNVEIVAAGLAGVVDRHVPGFDLATVRGWLSSNTERRMEIAARFDEGLPTRPPGFCIGCPERPVFSALKQVQQKIGKVHVAADIGCHSFATFEPFSSGHSILGYGMSLASAAGVGPMMTRRTLAIMGDGGFWHNGLLSGVQSALFNKDDVVLLILKNGYTSATGTQEIISSPDDDLQVTEKARLFRPGSQSLTENNRAIEDTLVGMGVPWLKTVYTYDVDAMMGALTDAFTTETPGLKVIVGEGECQLERQRRIKPIQAARIRSGKKTTRVKYGVDEDTCSGDHSCIRLSGCPTLTLKDANDPLKVDPVVTITEGCVGCGLCGSNAHAATLCPSFYRIEVTRNPTRWDRVRSWVTTASVARRPS